ncbi:UNVERIFIED_CONTAM: hypothetical protein Cloal_1492 [Acetivibrio alkalicellulosi]
MSNLGLILFEEKKHNSNINNIFKRFYYKIKSLFDKDIYLSQVEKIEVDERVNIFFIKLKSSLDQINEFRQYKIKKIKKNINKVLKEYSIENCILPEEVNEDFMLDCCIKNPFSGHFIYTALITDILKIIAYKKGISVKELDIAIIKGNESSLFYSYIELLSPIVKFITIIDNDRQCCYNKIEEIYDDTGLSVRITDDIKSGVDGVDVVINMANMDNLYKSTRIKSNAIVINYGTINENDSFLSNTIINGISISLDKDFENIMNGYVGSSYSRNELAELIVCAKNNINANVINNNADKKIIQYISNEFKKCGYRINGFIGRHNIVTHLGIVKK